MRYFCILLVFLLQSCGLNTPSTKRYVISHSKEDSLSQIEEIEETEEN